MYRQADGRVGVDGRGTQRFEQLADFLVTRWAPPRSPRFKTQPGSAPGRAAGIQTRAAPQPDVAPLRRQRVQYSVARRSAVRAASEPGSLITASCSSPRTAVARFKCVESVQRAIALLPRRSPATSSRLHRRRPRPRNRGPPPPRGFASRILARYAGCRAPPDRPGGQPAMHIFRELFRVPSAGRLLPQRHQVDAIEIAVDRLGAASDAARRCAGRLRRLLADRAHQLGLAPVGTR